MHHQFSNMNSTSSQTCNHVSSSNVSCFRKIQRGERFCSYHLATTTPSSINDICPICQEDDKSLRPGSTTEEGHEVKWYPLSCTHRIHVHCLKGMHETRDAKLKRFILQCPICRGNVINLPDNIRLIIEENTKRVEAENVEEEHREIMEMIHNGTAAAADRPPPQMELIMAMRYIYELGVPPHLIPGSITLEIDPESPLPYLGYIFQNAVAHILEHIQNTYICQCCGAEVEEIDDFDDGSLELDDPSIDPEEEIEDEDNPFALEGEDLRVVHSIRTVPRLPVGRQPGERVRARVARSIFSTMRFVISDLPSLTEEDLELIDVLNGGRHEDFIDD